MPAPRRQTPAPSPSRPARAAHVARTLLLLGLCAGLLVAPRRPVGAQAQLVLKMATTAATGSPLAQHLRSVADDVRGRSQGTTHPKVFTGGVLGDDTTLIARTIEGSIQMYAGHLRSLSETLPELAVLSSPFVFRDERRTDRALDRSVRRALQPMLEKRGLVFGGWAGNAERVLLAPKALRTAEDFAGMRLHTGTPHADLWLSALGATAAGPFPTAGAPAPGASAPIVDATPLQAAACGRDRLATHVLRARHALDVSILVFSKRWFDGLPSKAQADLRKPEAALTAAARARVRNQNARVLEAWAARGLVVHEPDKTERRSLVRALRKVPAQTAKRGGQGGFRLWRAAR